MESLPTESFTIESLPVEIIAMIGAASDPLTMHMLSLCRADWYRIAHRCECEKPCEGMCPNPYSLCIDAAAILAAMHNYPTLLKRVLDFGGIEMCKTVEEVAETRRVRPASAQVRLTGAVRQIERGAAYRGKINSYMWTRSLPKCHWMRDHDLVTSGAACYAMSHGHVGAIKIFIAAGFEYADYERVLALKHIESYKFVTGTLSPGFFYTVTDAAQHGSGEVMKHMIETLGLPFNEISTLHQVMYNDNADCLRYLLDKVPNCVLLTAMHLARSKCLKLLREHPQPVLGPAAPQQLPATDK